MESNPDVLLALLAVRLLGEQSVDAAALPLKALKEGVRKATAQGFLSEGKTKVPTVKAGKTTMKSVKVVGLTEQGQDHLLRAADPATIDATASGHLAAFKQALEQDRRQFHEEMKSALKDAHKVPDEKKAQKSFAELAKAIELLAKRVEQLEISAIGANETGGVTEKIDQGFEALFDRLERRLEAFPATAAKARPVAPAADDSLAMLLRKTYDKLCMFVEFREGVIDLPRLYYEARRAMPNLEVDAFHRELMTLWQRRELDLHVLNEEYRAAEPDLAIRYSDKLYYYVLWKRT